MTFNVLALTETPLAASAEISDRELDLGPDLKLSGPAQAAVELQRLGEKIHIRGTVQARVAMVCARCLEEYPQPVKAALDLVALPADGEGRASRQVEENAEEEDDSVMAYEHDQVDLLPEIRSALILALPMKPLCAEDCPGLCPECGQRLDGAHAPHGPEVLNGPFAALKNALDPSVEKKQ